MEYILLIATCHQYSPLMVEMGFPKGKKALEGFDKSGSPHISHLTLWPGKRQLASIWSLGVFQRIRPLIMMCTRATMARPVPHKIKNKREEKQKPYALLKLKYSTNIYIYIGSCHASVTCLFVLILIHVRMGLWPDLFYFSSNFAGPFTNL